MLKKLIIFLAVALPMAMMAQTGVGSWYVYGTFQNYDDIVETPSKVYYLSNGSLHSYDKETDESYSYSSANLLHDNSISMIEYNPLGKYLAVIYKNANIDLIKENGDVLNLSDIKDAVLNISPVINDIAFSNGQMAVATNFGIVLFDDKRGEVIESGMYNINVNAIALNDERIFIYYSNNGQNHWQTIEKSRHINQLDKFESIDLLRLQYMFADNNYIYVYTNEYPTNLRILKLNKKNGPGFGLIGVTTIEGVQPRVNFIDGGKFYMYSNDKIYVVDSEANVTETALPDVIKRKQVAVYNRPTLAWASTSDGLGRYDFGGGDVKVVNQPFKPAALNTSKIGHIKSLPEGGVMAYERSISDKVSSDWPDAVVHFNYVDGDNIEPFSYKDAGLDEYQNATCYQYYPLDRSVEFLGSERFGMFRLKDGVKDFNFNQNNSAIGGYNSWLASAPSVIDFDSRGNLYTAVWNRSTTPGEYGRIVMLPKNKVLSSDSNASDWVQILRQDQIMTSNEKSGRDVGFMVAKKSNLILFSTFFTEHLAIINTRGTDTNADDVIENYAALIDQDGKSVGLAGVTTMVFAEDLNGNIWIGTSKGIFAINNPSKLADVPLSFQRIKVPRNDGTNYADYLLDGVDITDIAVDSANNKWVATRGDGVYLVSEDGRSILQHFTTTNSSLPNDDVYAVACDVNSNEVYFGTVNGLVRYSSTTAPSADDLDDVYAYPNPVRPEYTGWIIIKNLIDGTVIKIADASGNVFFNGVSEGGMISWDGCDQSGQRVKTGVYYVFASKNGEQQSAKAVTKILVVN